MSAAPNLSEKNPIPEIASQGNIANAVPTPHLPIESRSPAETIDSNAGNDQAAQDASVSPPPASQEKDVAPAVNEEWLEKAYFRATYRTLQNDAEYARFDQQLHRARKEIANLHEMALINDL